jgi:hypothetical protein
MHFPSVGTLSLHLPQYDKSCVTAYTNYIFD